MIIDEEENENNRKFKIKRLKYNSDATDDKVLEPLPNGASFLCFIGRPKSGKTTVALNFLTRKAYYLKRFDKIFVFSPSIFVSLDKDHPLHTLPEKQKNTELTAENLQEAIDSIYDSDKRVLFLLDDVYQDFSGYTLTLVAKLCFNRRHLTKKGVSVWVCAQTFPQIPLKLRKTISDLFVFKTTNEREIEAIRSEYCDFMDKDDFHKLLDYVFDEKHNFLYLKTNHQPREMFYKNMNSLNISGV
jgi:hypothetical protein